MDDDGFGKITRTRSRRIFVLVERPLVGKRRFEYDRAVHRPTESGSSGQRLQAIATTLPQRDQVWSRLMRVAGTTFVRRSGHGASCSAAWRYRRVRSLWRGS